MFRLQLRPWRTVPVVALLLVAFGAMASPAAAHDFGSPVLSGGAATEGQPGQSNTVPFTLRVDPVHAHPWTARFRTVPISTEPGPDVATFGTLCVGGVDVRSVDAIVTVPADVQTLTINVPVCADTRDEVQEQFAAIISELSDGFCIEMCAAIGTINDDDPLVGFEPLPMVVTETNAPQTASFAVTLSSAAETTFNVVLDAQTMSAQGGALCAGVNDFISGQRVVAFEPGDVSNPVQVTVCGDQLDEGNEGFLLRIVGAGQASIGVPTRAVTIVDNDPLPSLSINNVTAEEGAGLFPQFSLLGFDVTLSAPSGRQVSVAWATGLFPLPVGQATSGTACGTGVDFLAASGTLVFEPGEVSKSILITVCEDALDEPTERLQVTLSNASQATIQDSLGIGNITNDDEPRVYATDTSVVEGAAGQREMHFEARLTNESVQDTTVSWAIVGGTAGTLSPSNCSSDFVDFLPGGGSVTIPARSTSAEFIVTVCGDFLVEQDETVIVQLSAPTNGEVVNGGDPTRDARGVGTILNDDRPLILP